MANSVRQLPRALVVFAVALAATIGVTGLLFMNRSNNRGRSVYDIVADSLFADANSGDSTAWPAPAPSPAGGGDPAAANASSWVVVSLIGLEHAFPRADVERWANATAASAWTLLVVVDTHAAAALGASAWTPPAHACVLDIEGPLVAAYRMRQRLPRRAGEAHVALAYLYAVHHGARFVYDANVHTIPALPSATALHTGFDGVVRRVPGTVLNPFEHFDAEWDSSARSTLRWPRGFPLSAALLTGNSGGAGGNRHSDQGVLFEGAFVAGIMHSYTAGAPVPLSAASYLQGLADTDQPSDATPPTWRQPPAPGGTAVLVGCGQNVPLNERSNTLFAYPALWAMFLPTSAPVPALWRGYWAKRLMDDLDLRLLLLGPVTSLAPVGDADSETGSTVNGDGVDLHLPLRELAWLNAVDEMVSISQAWRSSAPHFFDRALGLARALASDGDGGEARLSLFFFVTTRGGRARRRR